MINQLVSSQCASYASGSRSVSGTPSVILIFMNQPLPMGSSFRMPGVSVNSCGHSSTKDSKGIAPRRDKTQKAS